MEDLRIRQIDATLKPFQRAAGAAPPATGWVKTIRKTLGMSQRQLSERADLSTSAIQGVEGSEARGTVRMNSLKALANAMDCDLVYALVPRGSLKAIVERQAERIATGYVTRVSDSMDLEAQGVPAAERLRQVKAQMEEILRERGRDFWDV